MCNAVRVVCSPAHSHLLHCPHSAYGGDILWPIATIFEEAIGSAEPYKGVLEGMYAVLISVYTSELSSLL